MQETTTAAVPEAELSFTALTLQEPSLAELDDSELLALARSDHDEAYAALFTRHSYAARRLAGHLGHREEAEDIVAESFAQVLDLFRRGKGPERAFRAYLFTTVRHEAGRRAKARQRVMPTDDERQIDSIVPFGGGRLEDFEQAAIRGAYESLPDRWRTVLWHLDVEGRKPQEIGPMLKLSPNSVSALAYRARSALREAYLRQHINHERPAASRACTDVHAKLSAYVRRTATAREQAQVRTHLETCPECATIHADLQEVNRDVGTIAASAAVVVSLLGLVGAGAASGWSWLSAHVAALGKAVLTAMAPPATIAVVTAAAVVGVTGAADVVDPPRHPMTVQTETPHANRPRVASATDPTRSRDASGTSTPRSAAPPAGAAGKPAHTATPAPAHESSQGSATIPDPAQVSIPGGVSISASRDSTGVRTAIASVTVEIPSRLLASVLSQGTTN
jgi:RNA polymerase sigma factor (sigma-70 family)